MSIGSITGLHLTRNLSTRRFHQPLTTLLAYNLINHCTILYTVYTCITVVFRIWYQNDKITKWTINQLSYKPLTYSNYLLPDLAISTTVSWNLDWLIWNLHSSIFLMFIGQRILTISLISDYKVSLHIQNIIINTRQ